VNRTGHGIEGPAWGALKAAEQHTGERLADSPLFAAALEATRSAEPYPDLLAASSRLLAIARTASLAGVVAPARSHSVIFRVAAGAVGA
jgi:hypothetical protein